MKRILVSLFSILIAIVLITPATSFAANVYMEASRSSISVGDTIVVAVKINAEGAIINTVDGEVATKSGIKVQEFSLANSAFGLWPRTPSLSVDGKVISFVGGVPGGFSIEGATLFNIIVEATKEGKITLSPRNVSAYLNDGKGTKAPVTLRDLVIDVSPKKANVASQNDWSNLVSTDVLPPEKFIIVLGQDEKMYDGKIFAFFSAVDNQSGISYYEVSENGQPAVRSGSTYILKDQQGKAKLSVVAYDKAGNKREAVYSQGPLLSGVSWGWVLVIVLAVYIIVKIIKNYRNTNKDNVAN